MGTHFEYIHYMATSKSANDSLGPQKTPHPFHASLLPYLPTRLSSSTTARLQHECRAHLRHTWETQQSSITDNRAGYIDGKAGPARPHLEASKGGGGERYDTRDNRAVRAAQNKSQSRPHLQAPAGLLEDRGAHVIKGDKAVLTGCKEQGCLPVGFISNLRLQFPISPSEDPEQARPKAVRWRNMAAPRVTFTNLSE
jgi:hypothetical protein